MRNIIVIYCNNRITSKILERLLHDVEHFEIINVSDEESFRKEIKEHASDIYEYFIKDKVFSTAINSLFKGASTKPILVTSAFSLDQLSLNVKGVLETPFKKDEVENILEE